MAQSSSNQKFRHGRHFTQQYVMPSIYKTNLPDRLLGALSENDHNVIVLIAPTGIGKTVMANAVMAQIQKTLHNKGTTMICSSIMPFRVSVIEMWQYINVLFTNYKFGYAMRGSQQMHPNDNVRLNTVGYWLEKAMVQFRTSGLPKIPQIVMVDEAHDATWQTDLALRILLWMQNQGCPIKIVVTSATLDVAHTLGSSNQKPLMLTVDDQEANVDVTFLTSCVTAIDRCKLSNGMYSAISKQVVQIVKTSKDGDILVMLPGQDEINKFIEMLESESQLQDCIILPLWSSMDKDDIKAAIHPNSNGYRKIICATNVVENAITIDGLMFVVDSGYRKISEIDIDGVQQLVLSPAARSNMKQSLGRVGRQGRRGAAYLMLTQQEFELRPLFFENEVHRNPLYLQIIKLLRDGLPVKEVLSHIPPDRIDGDTKFLVTHGALEIDDNGIITVTKLGTIMAQLPLAIRSAHFLALTIIHLDPIYWYSAVVAAAWIDDGASVFYRPGRKPREDHDSYNSRLDSIQEVQEEFFKQDCMSTMFHVWFSSWDIPETYKGSFRGWCKDHGIFDRTLHNMNAAINHIMKSLGSMAFVVEIPKREMCKELVENVNETTKSLVPMLAIAYKDRKFNHEFGRTYKCESSGKHATYSIDRFIHNESLISGSYSENILALNLRRISPKLIIMSNIVHIS